MLAVRAYQLGVMLGGGLLPLLLERRAKAGREDPPAWTSAKLATWRRDRGKSRLAHAASVGETRSALPLLADFLAPAGHTYSHHNGDTNFGNTGRPVKARKFSRY